jgi:phage baseplate assembly protein W
MRGLRLADGDLLLSDAGRCEVVTGQAKLIQTLSLWLREPLGAGFVTVNFGTRLDDMVGEIGDDAALAEAADEVRRVLRLYQADQFEAVKEAQEEGQLFRFTRDEILDSIGDVRASWISETQIGVTAQIGTGAGTTASVYLEMGGE